MKTLIASLLLALVVPSAAHAAGAEFTFNVPYQIDSIPSEIKQARILCAVLDARRTQLGQGIHNFTVSVGPKRNATIKVKLTDDRAAAAAARYACYLEPPFGKRFNEDASSKLVVEGPIPR